MKTGLSEHSGVYIKLFFMLILSSVLSMHAELWARLDGNPGELALRDSLNMLVPGYESVPNVYEGLFSNVEPMKLTLKFDLKTLQRTRRQEKYQAAEMINHVNDAFWVRNPVRVKARGSYRRDNCDVPPFWLNIRNSGIGTREFEGVRRMKMVIPCRETDQYEDYILREYLVYRIYNLVSPYSYRVRLVRLSFVDTGRDNRESESWAFLIEPDEMMASRLNARVIKSNELSMKTVNIGVMDLMSMFQYMIGNGDFSVTGRHNLRILAMTSPGPIGFVPVPYDFDYSGLVNTRYAVPNESLGLNSVRERYFLGPQRSSYIHMMAFEKLQAVRDEIMELIKTFEYLPEDEREDMLAYLESFYTTVQEDDWKFREK